MRTENFTQLLTLLNTSYGERPAFITAADEMAGNPRVKTPDKAAGKLRSMAADEMTGRGRAASKVTGKLRGTAADEMTGKRNGKTSDKMTGKCRDKTAGMNIITYHELYVRVRTLSEKRLVDGSKCIGICGPPSPSWVINMFAAVCAGKRTVLLDPAVNWDDLRDIMILTGMDDLWASDPGIRDAFMRLRDDPGISAACAADERKFHEENPEMPGDAVECGGELLFFTSGTTAKRKAVVLSQKALLSSAWNGQQMMRCRPEDTVLCLLPLNHVFGFVCSLLWPVTNGAAVAFGRGMRHFSDDPAFFHTTILPVVPTLLGYLLKTNALNRELSGLLVGAGPCDMDSLRRVWMRGIDLRFGYGLTETASGLAISLRGENPFSMALCPETEITIGDDEQIYVRTTCMMDGYYHDPVHTSEKMTDKGLATGDTGYLDDKGRLHVRGRIDDVLVRANGEKIFLREWEEELSKITGSEAVLFEQDHKLTLAVHGAESEEILRRIDDYNKRQPLGRKIDDVRFVKTQFPRTQTGKLQRWKIKEECE